MTDSFLRIMVARHSTFYSPLLLAIGAGFLGQEGIKASYSVLPAGCRSHDLLRNREVDIMQSAVSSNWGPMEKGERDLPVHFAQINQRDGFFFVGRARDSSFRWSKLEGKQVLADHGSQPLAMLRYAAYYQGVDYRKIEWINAGNPEEMDAAFRVGRGDYVHLQGPAAQQLESDSIGCIVASVGEAMPPVAFSSLMASRAFLKTETAKAFVKAFQKAKKWVNQAPVEEIARAEASFFPGVDLQILTASIARYRKLGCWAGDVDIPRALYEQALNVFLHCGAISRRHAYEEVVAAIPE